MDFINTIRRWHKCDMKSDFLFESNMNAVRSFDIWVFVLYRGAHKEMWIYVNTNVKQVQDSQKLQVCLSWIPCLPKCQAWLNKILSCSVTIHCHQGDEMILQFWALMHCGWQCRWFRFEYQLNSKIEAKLRKIACCIELLRGVARISSNSRKNTFWREQTKTQFNARRVKVCPSKVSRKINL